MLSASPLALEHFDRQVVTIIEHRVDLARQVAKPRRPLIPPLQTSRNARHGRHARRRVSLSLAGLKASVSHGEIR
jgi:hypothetical protein